MGTPATLRVHDGDDVVLTAQRQSDGYPTSFGLEVSTFLAGITIVRGISRYDAPIANGMGCLAAQLVKALKEDVGGFYLSAPSADTDGWSYDVRPERLEDGWCGVGKPMLTVRHDGMPLWDGPAAKFAKTVASRVEKKATELACQL